jgi:hypothetical protein
MSGAIPPLQYPFMAWCLVKHRDSFYPLDRRLGGTQSHSGRGGEGQKFVNILSKSVLVDRLIYTLFNEAVLIAIA